MSPPMGAARAAMLAQRGDGVPAGVVDNFEPADGSIIGPYESGDSLSTLYSGYLSHFSRIQTGVEEGSYQLEINADAGGRLINSSPGDGLPRYLEEGGTVAWLVEDNGTAGQIIVAFSGSSGSESGYSYFVDEGNNQIRVARYDNGGFTEIASTNTTISAGTVYWAEGTVPSSSSDAVEMDLYQVTTTVSPPRRGEHIASASTTDSNYNGQAFALRSGGSNTTTLIDWIQSGDIQRTADSPWVDVSTYNSNNPLITANDNADADTEQYSPAIVETPGGTYYMYVKSDELSSGSESLLRLWSSTNGVSWTRESTTFGPSDVSNSVTSLAGPSILYDPNTSTYHMWYRERGGTEDAIGHATGSSVDALTEAGNSPVLTVSDLPFSNVNSLTLNQAITLGGTAHFYGAFEDGTWKLFYGTANDYDSSISPQSEILSGITDGLLAPSVFEHPDNASEYVMFVARGDFDSEPVETYAATSSNGTSWDMGDVAVLIKAGTWRDRWTYGGQWLKENTTANLTLATVNSSYRFYFNGQDDTLNGSVGLLELSSIPDTS